MFLAIFSNSNLLEQVLTDFIRSKFTHIKNTSLSDSSTFVVRRSLLHLKLFDEIIHNTTCLGAERLIVLISISNEGCGITQAKRIWFKLRINHRSGFSNHSLVTDTNMFHLVGVRQRQVVILGRSISGLGQLFVQSTLSKTVSDTFFFLRHFARRLLFGFLNCFISLATLYLHLFFFFVFFLKINFIRIFVLSIGCPVVIIKLIIVSKFINSIFKCLLFVFLEFFLFFLLQFFVLSIVLTFFTFTLGIFLSQFINSMSQ